MKTTVDESNHQYEVFMYKVGSIPGSLVSKALPKHLENLFLEVFGDEINFTDVEFDKFLKENEKYV